MVGGKAHAATGRFLGLMVWLLAAASFCAVPASAANHKNERSQKVAPQSSLRTLMLVSTRAAARAAARAKTAKQAGKTATAKVPAVSEFHATTEGSLATGSLVVDKGKKAHGLLKSIHGSLYGVNGAGERVEGGNVGATSKNGKTSIFVGSQGASAKNP